MKNLRRIVDYSTFAGSINKSKRSKLVAHIHRERTNKRLPEREVEVMPLCGWYEYADPVKERRKDSGEIKAFIRMKDVVFMVFDNLTDGAEDYYYTFVDEDIVDFIGAAQPTDAPMKKDGTPFAGFNGGRKRKVLTDEEKARIREMRDAGCNINKIAKELHISNRVISEFVKNN